MPRSAGHTLTIDRDAFERIEQARSEGESASDVIKRYVPPRINVDDILKAFRSARLSPATIRAIEESAARRRSIPHRSKR